MSVLAKIACLQGRKDELPNQELARILVETNNVDGIREIVANLDNADTNIQSDCIKVLYEAGYIKPDMIADYVVDFIKLLGNRNNRLVWGAMLSLSTIATIKADEIYKHLETILRISKEGSVIAVDNAIKVLAAVAAKNDEYNEAIFPFLIENLSKCRPKEVGQHAESTLQAVNLKNQDDFFKVLRLRENSLTKTQRTRINKLCRKFRLINS